MKQKYICVDTGLCDSIIIFPETITHADFGHQFKIISAGFIYTDTWSCFGKSTSLGLSARPEDTIIARRQYVERD